MIDHFEKTFPTTVIDFQGSSAELTIRALESFYSSVPTNDFSQRLYKHQRTFLLTTRVLDALSQTDLQSPNSPVTKRTEVASSKKTSQKEAKRARMKRPDLSIDDTPFQNLGLHRPTTPLEYDSIVEEIMDRLKGILRVRTHFINPLLLNIFIQDYLLNMGNPDILKHCVQIYISCRRGVHYQGSSQALGITNIDTQPDPESATTTWEAPLLYPINPINTIRYFDDGIEGFGSWKILLSTKCEGDLRKFRRADAKRFAIIERKIKYTPNPCLFLIGC